MITLACGLPGCLPPNTEQTGGSISLRTTAVALALIAIIVGALILTKVDPFSQLNAYYGWGFVAGGVITALVAGCIQCVRGKAFTAPKSRSQLSPTVQVEKQGHTLRYLFRNGERELRILALNEADATKIASVIEKDLGLLDPCLHMIENNQLAQSALGYLKPIESLKNDLSEKLGSDFHLALFLTIPSDNCYAFALLGPRGILNIKRDNKRVIFSFENGTDVVNKLVGPQIGCEHLFSKTTFYVQKALGPISKTPAPDDLVLQTS